MQVLRRVKASEGPVTQYHNHYSTKLPAISGEAQKGNPILQETKKCDSSNRQETFVEDNMTQNHRFEPRREREKENQIQETDKERRSTGEYSKPRKR